MPGSLDLLAFEGAPLEPATNRVVADSQGGCGLADGDRRSPVAGLSTARRCPVVHAGDDSRSLGI